MGFLISTAVVLAVVTPVLLILDWGISKANGTAVVAHEIISGKLFSEMRTSLLKKMDEWADDHTRAAAG